MKLSVSLSEAEVELLDRIVAQGGLPSRSAAIQKAIKAFARPDLTQQYEAAFIDWDSSGDSQLWDSTSGDGLADHSR